MERGSFVGSFCKWEILSSEGGRQIQAAPHLTEGGTGKGRGRVENHWRCKIRKEELEDRKVRGKEQETAKGYSGVGWVTKRLAGLWTKF